MCCDAKINDISPNQASEVPAVLQYCLQSCNIVARLSISKFSPGSTQEKNVSRKNGLSKDGPERCQEILTPVSPPPARFHLGPVPADLPSACVQPPDHPSSQTVRGGGGGWLGPPGQSATPWPPWRCGWRRPRGSSRGQRGGCGRCQGGEGGVQEGGLLTI